MAPIATNTDTPASSGATSQKAKYSSKEIMHMEHEYSAYVPSHTEIIDGKQLMDRHNYHPLPV
jgi:hypothetical protein